MNDTETTPLYDAIQHEQRHQQVADPDCAMCAAQLRHPAGDAIAAAREQAQHDAQAAADEAVEAQDDEAFLARRMWLFAVVGGLLVVAGPVLAFAVRPLTGAHWFAVLVTVAGGACILAAAHLRNVRDGGEGR